MSVEMKDLLLAVILGFVQLTVQALSATAARGKAWNLSSRDANLPPLTGLAGRADRAFENFKETFPFFLAAVFLVMHTGRGGNLSAIGAYAYLGARLVYIPLYLFNVTGVRTAVWAISALGIVLILVQSVIG
jgi:uncharacterized MAPEG superfamily protein